MKKKESMFIPNLSKLMHCHRLLMGPKSLEASRLQETEMNLMEGFSNGFVKVSGVSCFSCMLRSLPAVVKSCLFSGLVYPVWDNTNSVHQKFLIKHILFLLYFPFLLSGKGHREKSTWPFAKMRCKHFSIWMFWHFSKRPNEF